MPSSSRIARTLVGNAAEIAKLLPPELIAGLRMDINRPFGDGRDDNNNGVVSTRRAESVPTIPPRRIPPIPRRYSAHVGRELLNVTNWNSSLNPADPLMSANLPAGVKARQLMARHLYALMMLFADQGFTNWTIEPGIAPGSQQASSLRHGASRNGRSTPCRSAMHVDHDAVHIPMGHLPIDVSRAGPSNGDPGDMNNRK